MAIAIKDLQKEVDRLNAKYCAKSKHRLVISRAYGGCKVDLTGKPRKDGKGYRGMGTATSNVTRGYTSTRQTLTDLIYADASGIIKDRVKRCDGMYPRKSKRK